MAVPTGSSKTQTVCKAPLASQSLAVLPMALTAMLGMWGVVQLCQSEASFGGAELGYCLVVSYVYTDYWLWMLHCFLDRKENLESRIGPIAHLAKEFQAC